jgi:hypothetical protein
VNRRACTLFAATAAVIGAGGELLAATWHLGYWHGLYCSLGTAATAGCDTAPRAPAGWAAACAVILIAIPLLATAFGQLHLDKIRAHVDTRFAENRKDTSDQAGGGDGG